MLDAEHICTIGVLHKYDYAETVGIAEVILYSEDRKDLYEYEKNLQLINVNRYFTMKEYLDRRVSTNLQRFVYCPYCGKKINWKALREKYGGTT